MTVVRGERARLVREHGLPKYFFVIVPIEQWQAMTPLARKVLMNDLERTRVACRRIRREKQ